VENDHKVSIISGPQEGSAANFLFLINSVPVGTELIAFSDQDDVWLPEKLARARQVITEALQQGEAILYVADSFVCDQYLALLHPFRERTWKPSVGNSFVQSIGGGNTMMLNGPAISLLQEAAHVALGIVVHDWWTYQIISCCGGTVLRDTNAVLYYRQHGNNLIGSNKSLRGQLQRVLFVSDRRFVMWNDKNIATLKTSRHMFTPAAKRALSYYIAARHGHLVKRIVSLYRSGAVRQRRRGNVALYLACLARKL
jgi:hypothetical protein